MLNKNKLYLGIELGSTRIKAVLIDECHTSIATGNFTWENQLINGFWTYSLDDVWRGIQAAYKELAANFENKHNSKLTTLNGIGISAMMHGYLPFDKDGNQLAAFRTWRNTTTGAAAEMLTKEFGFNIPERWSVAHLYQAILNGEEHVADIAYITTLAGYVHLKLTGENVLGVGDASGMFPVNGEKYNSRMLEQFANLAKENNFAWKIENIFPKILLAGEQAGFLTVEGAKMLDPSENLQPGIPFCPPEGDAGTGMVATNSVAPRIGNISAGTSIFFMIVLKEDLLGVYPEIDIVTTPCGNPVAMVHCNNCTSDIDAWVNFFDEILRNFGVTADKSALYETLYNVSQSADEDCGGLLSYNYFSGEQITKIKNGRPLFARMPDSKFTLANFMRNLLFSSVATLRIGMDILEKENVKLDRLAAHGGLFKTPNVGQNIVAAALNTAVSVSDSAAEGGAWGIAVLAAFAQADSSESLGEYLENVFVNDNAVIAEPNPEDIKNFKLYMKKYKAGIAIQRAAEENL
ncbi:MAG: FGGY-family carbohydrate kinase [Oscillospiraceae bacterium]|nr:FGGY-family carbohydrate kinase [Oscillospiraceae bacterium]